MAFKAVAAAAAASSSSTPTLTSQTFRVEEKNTCLSQGQQPSSYSQLELDISLFETVAELVFSFFLFFRCFVRESCCCCLQQQNSHGTYYYYIREWQINMACCCCSCCTPFITRGFCQTNKLIYAPSNDFLESKPIIIIVLLMFFLLPKTARRITS